MKPLAEVHKTREEYHRFPAKKSVHRSSLIVPNLDGCEVLFSFLNHFLIKRGYPQVACKVTAIDAGGNQLDSIMIEVTRPSVHTINPRSLFSDLSARPTEYLVEFFSDKNLFIPFPAVIVNHVGDQFCNVVHSYNRTLNDIWEDDAINRVAVSEASIDFVSSHEFETFFNFATGVRAVAGNLHVSYADREGSYDFEIPVSMKRLSNQSFVVSDYCPKLKGKSGGVLKITQPKQEMFYGRLFAGTLNKKTGSFSANHSFYDSSKVEEYFESRESYRTYPYFDGFMNRVLVYPIMSPGKIKVKAEIQGANRTVFSEEFELISPSNVPVSIDVSEVVAREKIEGATAFTIIASDPENNIPTRVNHQLIYGEKSGANEIRASINVSLANKKAFAPQGKKGFTWGQAVVGGDYESRLAVVFNSAEGQPSPVQVDFYDGNGLFHSVEKICRPGSSLVFDMKDIAKLSRESSGALSFIWFVAKTDRSDVFAYSVHVNKISGNASGEHSF